MQKIHAGGLEPRRPWALLYRCLQATIQGESRLSGRQHLKVADADDKITQQRIIVGLAKPGRGILVLKIISKVYKFTKNAEKDKKLLKSAGLEEKVKKLLNLIANNPFQMPPSYEKLVGDLDGYYSRRINLQHRLVYKEINAVVVHSMRSHYGDN